MENFTSMKIIVALCIIGLSGCASVTKTVTGPGGYKYQESITAFGGGSIEKATQTFGGTLKVYNVDGTPQVEVALDSAQKGEGLTSDPAVLKQLVLLMGQIMANTP